MKYLGLILPMLILLMLIPAIAAGQTTIQGAPNGYPVSVTLTSGGSTPAIVQSTPNTAYPAAFSGLPIQVLGATSGTVATASTVLIGTIYCVNLSASAATVMMTNTAGTYLVGGSAGFSIPANSDVTRNFNSGLLAVGVKWWAGTAAVINCSITGWN